MGRSVRDWFWQAWFFVVLTSLIAAVVLIPLWTVLAIPYGIITGNDNFVMGGGLGIFPGMAIVAMAWGALDNNP